MAADDLTFFERLRGKRTRDINLPSEGQIDPRLANKANVLAGLKTAAENYKKLQKNAIIGEALGGTPRK